MKTTTLNLNGTKTSHMVEPRETLADFLRDRCGLTGTHLGCEHGACGACTIVVDGQATRSCLQLAIMCDGRSVLTIEGLRNDPVMDLLRRHFHPLMPCSAASVPGMLITARDILRRVKRPDARPCAMIERTDLPLYRLCQYRQSDRGGGRIQRCDGSKCKSVTMTAAWRWCPWACDLGV